MVKAKDILNKSPEEFEDDPLEKDEQKDEGERVNEAYESLSKKLEDIRNGKKDEDESEESEESKESDESEDEEKEEEVKDDDEKEDELDKEEIEDDEKKDDEEKEHEIEKEEELAPEEPKHTFIKAEEDPLDKDADLSEEEVKKENESESQEEKDSKSQRVSESEESGEADTLEDLIKEDEEESAPKMEKSMGVASDVPQRPSFQNQNREEMGIPPLGVNNGQTSRPPYSSYPPRFGSNRPVAKSASKWHVVILLLIGLAVIGGTVYFLKNQFKTNPQTPPPASSTPVPTSTPTPTPTPLDRTQFKIRVLNGTTTSGLAATVSTKLEELGYGKDRTGNATNSAFEKTEIRAKAATPELIEQLIRDLAPDYNAASSSSPLKDSDAADAEVIIGQQ